MIRQLRAGDDLAAAVDLLFRFFAEEGFTADRARIARHAAVMAGLETCGLFVAEELGAAIAVATVSLKFGIEYGWGAEMGDLYVVPEWRGRGVSQALVEAVEAWLHSRGATGYQVTVTPFGSDHHDLAKFYERLGFGSEGRVILMKTLGRLNG